jgi:hypothetical protein
MNPFALRLAAELGGSLLSGPVPALELLVMERIQAHGLPQVLVAARHAGDLDAALAAATQVQNEGLGLNLIALLPLPSTDLAQALRHHRRRLGALVCALDAGLPWLENKPMLPKRLPGLLAAAKPLDLEKAPLSPLEKAELKAFLPHWDRARRRATFRRPDWRRDGDGFCTALWPGVQVPPGATVTVPPLELPTAAPVVDALRAALRGSLGVPVPFLPMSSDPSLLHALRLLRTDTLAFRGPEAAWCLALRNLAALPAPMHFCARC